MLYGHGDNGYLYGREIVADFSSNVWYGGEPAGLKEHLFGQWKRITRYPEVLAESLVEKVSRQHGLSPENILITNGATESIYLMAQWFVQKRSCIVIPSFSEYEDACRIYQHRIDYLDWEDLEGEALGTGSPDGGRSVRTGQAPGADLFWIGNPNNPTGAVFPSLETVVRVNGEMMFVADEAFIEFTSAIPSSVGLVAACPNLAVIRSMTKAFAIPGLRLGYIAAHKNVIGSLKRLKLPWSVNAMALEAGNFIYDNYTDILLPLKQLLEDKAVLVEGLRSAGVKTYESETHFFLCRTAHGSAGELKEYLLEKFGLLIRDAGNFRGLGKDHFRIATLDPGKNQLLVNAMKEWEKQSA